MCKVILKVAKLKKRLKRTRIQRCKHKWRIAYLCDKLVELDQCTHGDHCSNKGHIKCFKCWWKSADEFLKEVGF